MRTVENGRQTEYLQKVGLYSGSASKQLLWLTAVLFNLTLENYSGDEDIQSFCLEIAITERAYVLLKGQYYSHLLITASLEASREDDYQASPSVFM